MSNHPPGFASMLPALAREARRRILLVATLFSIVAIGALVVGLLLPKTWECSASLVPDATALKPLMQGRGGENVNMESQVATMVQAVQTRKIFHEVLEAGGWISSKLSPTEEEVLLFQLRSRLHIESARDAMIRISYRDSIPKRAFDITNKMVEIVIREAANAKEASSRETYEFIDHQVKKYSGELVVAHDKLLAYYRSQGVPSAGAESEGSEQEAPAPPRDRAHAGRLSVEELARLRAEEATLTAQLAQGRATVSPAAETSRAEEQLRARVEQLRFEYERLAASYTERHPDVVRKANDLDAARQDLRRVEATRLDNEKARAATSELDDQVARAARIRLEEVRALIASGTQQGTRGSRPRPSPVPRLAAVSDSNLVDPDMRHVGQDSRLSELLRRYETTRDVYQDLLRKRESARLSLNLDVERSSVILKVHEPPTMPVIARGLRVMHRSLIGIVLAAAVPFGVLVGIVSLDGRVRSAEQIERAAQVPVLGNVPYAPSGEKRRRAQVRKVLSIFMVASVLAAYVIAFLLTKAKIPQ